MSPIPAPAPAPRTHTYFGLVLRQLRAPHPSYDGPICDGRLPSRPCEAGNHIRSTRTGSRGWPRRRPRGYSLQDADQHAQCITSNFLVAFRG
jgi:hypothetical protein